MLTELHSLQMFNGVMSVWKKIPSHTNQQNSFKPRHDKTNKMSVHPAKTHISLGIRPVRSESSLCAQWVAKSCGQQRLWSDWVDAQAERSRRWAHTHFVLFVMSWLISYYQGIFTEEAWIQAKWTTGVKHQLLQRMKLLTHIIVCNFTNTFSLMFVWLHRRGNARKYRLMRVF